MSVTNFKITLAILEVVRNTYGRWALAARGAHTSMGGALLPYIWGLMARSIHLRFVQTNDIPHALPPACFGLAIHPWHCARLLYLSQFTLVLRGFNAEGVVLDGLVVERDHRLEAPPAVLLGLAA